MLLLLPVGMNYRTERLPIVTLSLISVNTLVYLVSAGFFLGTHGDSDKWIYENLWLVPSVSYPWMYLTSMFVHANFFHLLGNMLFLFLFGCCVEDIIGRWKFLGFYLLGGFIAEIVYIGMSPAHFSSAIPMGGASGAIAACMGMYLLLRTNSDIEFKYFFWFLFAYVRYGEFEVPAWIAVPLWFAGDFFWAIFGLFHHQESGGGVAFGAHVGGFLGGLGLIGIYKLIERGRPQEEEPPTSFIPVHKFVPVPIQNSSAEIATIYLHENGEQSGPFTLSQIQSALANGAISGNAVYWSEGMADWQSVLDLPAQ
ncbi:MAG TPA: rhomboid family intramembrane serine protease [Candidatus Baltobacteraceae bacterium]|nr:rhomboid family intramembrane serine protease [Candidatus Baltobacteraceae bacterium]